VKVRTVLAALAVVEAVLEALVVVLVKAQTITPAAVLLAVLLEAAAVVLVLDTIMTQTPERLAVVVLVALESFGVQPLVEQQGNIHRQTQVTSDGKMVFESR
jgi:hypothetical protein